MSESAPLPGNRTGADASHLALTPARAAAVVVTFVGTAVLFWLYFDEVADRAAERLASAGPERGKLARDAFTYLHIPIVAGMLVTAVGDELVIAHPLEPCTTRSSQASPEPHARRARDLSLRPA